MAMWRTQVAQMVKNLPAMRETRVRFPGGGNGSHSSILAWRIPWTEEPGGLPFMGSQRVGHWETNSSAAGTTSAKTCPACCVIRRDRLRLLTLKRKHPLWERSRNPISGKVSGGWTKIPSFDNRGWGGQQPSWKKKVLFLFRIFQNNFYVKRIVLTCWEQVTGTIRWEGVFSAPFTARRSSRDWCSALSASSTGWTVVPRAAGPALGGVGAARPLLGNGHPSCPQEPSGHGRTPPPLVLESACRVGLDDAQSSLMHAFPSNWGSGRWLLFIP